MKYKKVKNPDLIVPPSRDECIEYETDIYEKSEFDLVKNEFIGNSEKRISIEDAIRYFRKGFLSEVEIFRFLESEDCEKKSGKNFTDLTTEEITASFQEAVAKAIGETHAMGLPTTHGDGEDIFRIYPDGRKEIIGKCGELDYCKKSKSDTTGHL